MAKEHRIIMQGRPLDYTCQNERFKTDTKSGHSHRRNQRHKGSALGLPLLDNTEDGYSLWLEHVTDRKNPKKPGYWFMWYEKGIPTIPLSGIFYRDDIQKIAHKLNEIG